MPYTHASTGIGLDTAELQRAHLVVQARASGRALTKPDQAHVINKQEPAITLPQRRGTTNISQGDGPAAGRTRRRCSRQGEDAGGRESQGVRGDVHSSSEGRRGGKSSYSCGNCLDGQGIRRM